MFELPGTNPLQPSEQKNDSSAGGEHLSELTVCSQTQSRRIVLEPEYLGQKTLEVDVPLSLEGYCKKYSTSCLKLDNGGIDYIFQQMACATMFQESDKPFLFQSATGSGKTIVALVSAAPILSLPGGKVLFVTPDYALVEQIARDTEIVYREDTVSVLKITGKLSPKQRNKIYQETLDSDDGKKGLLCVANPEVIVRDVNNKVLALDQFSAVFFDEVHVAVGKNPYVELARLCEANPGQKRLFFSAWPARTRSDRIALMGSVGAEYFIKLNTPGTEVVDSVERVSLWGKMERAETKLRSAIHEVTIGLGKMLRYTNLSKAVFEDENLERISKLLVKRANHRNSRDDSDYLFSDMTPQEDSAPNRRKEVPKDIFDPEKIQSGPLKVSSYGELNWSSAVDVETLRECLPKIVEGLKNWQGALLEKFRKIGLQKTAQGWVVKTPSAGEFLSFQRNFDGFFALTKDLEKSVVFGSAKSLLSELGHLRHLHSVLMSQGKYAFLEFALNGLACVRLEGGGHQYLKRAYRDRLVTGGYTFDHSDHQSAGAIAEIAKGTPYELLFQKKSWEEVVQELHGPSNLRTVTDCRNFFKEHCFDFMVQRKEWDHPKEALEHRWIQQAQKLIGDGKILLRVDQANVAHFRKARIEHHLRTGAEWLAGTQHMTKTEQSAALERFRAPEVKVLVFTKVGTQGLDIKKGKLLLVETPPLVSTDLVQLRGRIGRREKLLESNETPGIMVTLLTAAGTQQQRTQDEIRYAALSSQIKKKDREEAADGKLHFENP